MKKFIVVGSKSAITYKDVFPMLKDRKMFVHIVSMDFIGGGVPSAWYNNVAPVKKEPILLTKTYNPVDYPKYDNYDAIEVSKVKDIPYDYDGVMGVPITFLDKWDDEEFEVVDSRGYTSIERLKNKDCMLVKDKDISIDGKPTFARILIKKKVEFEVVSIACGNSWVNYKEELEDLNFNPDMKYGGGMGTPIINGRPLYGRILIRRKKILKNNFHKYSKNDKFLLFLF